MKSLILIITITTLFPGCKKETLNLMQPKQEILFQFEYVNYAWGYQHYGWLIDSTGNIYTFNKPENWNFADSTGTITEHGMLENMSKTKVSAKKIDRNILKEKIALINKASMGKLSDPHCTMADFGGLIYYTFIYNHEEKRYTQILLNEYGDCSIVNQSKEANDLYEWLKTLKPN